MSAPRVDLNAVLEAFAAALAARLGGAANDAPRWRTLAAEAERRGFPSPRALRDWCRAAGVPVRGAGKHQVVCVADLDAALERVPEAARAEPSPRPKRPAASMDSALASAGLRVVATGGKGAR
jgi:hypothetical protein